MKSFGFSREDAQMGTDGGRKLKKHLADASLLGEWLLNFLQQFNRSVRLGLSHWAHFIVLRFIFVYVYFVFMACCMYVFAFSASTLLVGQQEGHQACKN